MSGIENWKAEDLLALVYDLRIERDELKEIIKGHERFLVETNKSKIEFYEELIKLKIKISELENQASILKETEEESSG
jgi:hypothetical protein